jgi:hypothetical protein
MKDLAVMILLLVTPHAEGGGEDFTLHQHVIDARACEHAAQALSIMSMSLQSSDSRLRMKVMCFGLADGLGPHIHSMQRGEQQ